MRFLMQIFLSPLCLCLASTLLFLASSACAQSDAVVGVWLTADKDGKIEVYRSGDRFFGKLVWGKGSTDEKGQPRLDVHNPDPQLRQRKLIGLVMMENFVYDQNHEWKGGTIYDSRNGKTYACKMTLANKNTLEVRGFIGFSLMGKTTVWTRVQTGT